MSNPFLGEIKMFGGNFPPRGYAFCNGQVLSIAQNTALFSLLGVNYGGNGQTTFALPNLQGNVAVGAGLGPGLTERVVGEVGGADAVTLVNSEMPGHTHSFSGLNARAASSDPANNLIAANSGVTPFTAPGGPVVPLSPLSVQPVGGGGPHNNRQPFLSVNFIIALQGIYPSRN